MRILRRLTCLVLLLAGPSIARAADALDLGVPTVLASPGCPEALRDFLPHGRPPAPLAWPLPDGPLLLLGLPEADPLALELAEAWGILPADRDLHGGYVRVAWDDGRRPIAVVLGADAAALYAARFELRVGSPQPVGMPDVARPPPAGTLSVARRWRHVRPHYRVRAVWPQRAPAERLLDRLVAGRANRVFVDEQRDAGWAASDFVPELRRYGIEPVLVVRPRDASTAREPLAARVAPWRDACGVRRFVLLAHAHGTTRAEVRAAVDALRESGPVDELVLVSEHGPGPDTTRLVGLVEATRLAAAARPPQPALFHETWDVGIDTPVPSRPRGRPPALGRRLAGVVIGDGPSLEAILAHAWEGPADGPPAWETHLLPLLPRGGQDARGLLETTRRRLGETAAGTDGAVPWMEALASSIADDLEHLPADAVLVPRVPAPIRADGRLDEPAWRWAARFEVVRADGTRLTLLAVADGYRLALALRAPPTLEEAVFEIGPARDAGGRRGGFGGKVGATLSPHGVFRTTEDGTTWEGVLDRSDLAGDAHPARTFALFAWVRVPETGELVRQRLAALVLAP